MTDTTFLYDVAFSFLKEDEGIASSLNDLLEGRLKTFLYSKDQESIAGTDGELAFGKVFGGEARIVVVLYRAGWGSTPWTRIEETAIRNRAYDVGYDFTVFIPLDTPPEVPTWLPKTRIWVGLDRWGLEGAASVVESRVQEAGGSPSQESFADRMERAKRALKAKEDVRRFLASREGVDACKAEVRSLFEMIEEFAQVASAPELGRSIIVEKRDRQCVVGSGTVSLNVFFSLRWGNTLESSGLHVEVWEGGWAFRLSFLTEDRYALLEEAWDFDLDTLGQSGWRLREDEGRFLATVQMAEHCLELILSHQN